MSAGGPVLELRSLTKEYPGHRALDGISLSLAPGEFFALLGPSGCGKTTTLRLIAGFDQPTSGEILLNGVSLTDTPPYRRNVSTVFQNYALFPHMTVGQNVAFGLRQRRVRRPKPIVDAILELVRLSGKGARFPSQLSGGEKQRVALARSLVLRPDVLLLDEPLAALDPQLRKQVRGELKQLQKDARIAFLFVTHDQEEALSLSDRLALLKGGKIEQMGTPQELYRYPRTRFAAEFLGEVNWLDGVGVRPESTGVYRDPPGRQVEIIQAQFLGASFRLSMRTLAGEPVTALLPAPPDWLRPGAAAWLRWDPSHEIRPS